MDRMTLKQAIVMTGFTGNLCCPFSYYHSDAEKRLGRPIYTHEFGNDDTAAELKEAYRADFLAMLPIECEGATECAVTR